MQSRLLERTRAFAEPEHPLGAQGRGMDRALRFLHQSLLVGLDTLAGAARVGTRTPEENDA